MVTRTDPRYRDADAGQSQSEIADDLSFALLLTLEKLTPPERAAFLLHDVFETPFSQIAEILQRSEASCRQLAARARKSVRSTKTGRPASIQTHKILLKQFIDAVTTGNLGGLKDLLATDAIAVADGGGVKIAARLPIYGADKIARFFIGIARKSHEKGDQTKFVSTDINGSPGALVFLNGELDQTISFSLKEGLINAIYVVRNPEKLAAIRYNA